MPSEETTRFFFLFLVGLVFLFGTIESCDAREKDHEEKMLRLKTQAAQCKCAETQQKKKVQKTP